MSHGVTSAYKHRGGLTTVYEHCGGLTSVYMEQKGLTPASVPGLLRQDPGSP